MNMKRKGTFVAWMLAIVLILTIAPLGASALGSPDGEEPTAQGEEASGGDDATEIAEEETSVDSDAPYAGGDASSGDTGDSETGMKKAYLLTVSTMVA